jgi:hypothetical protein
VGHEHRIGDVRDVSGVSVLTVPAAVATVPPPDVSIVPLVIVARPEQHGRAGAGACVRRTLGRGRPPMHSPGVSTDQDPERKLMTGKNPT